MKTLTWSDLFYYKKNNRLLFASIIISVLAFIVYMLFFDILIPNLPTDSYRAVIGNLFFIPVLILVVGQAFFGGFLLHMITSALNPSKRDFLKAFFITSIITFLFSLTYVMFPFYGPFYYIVFAAGGPWYALPVEIIWSLVTLTAGSLLTSRFYNIPIKISYFISLIIIAVIVLAAS